MQQRLITFDVTAFRTQFTNFVNDVVYPTATLQGWWNIATNFVSPVNYGWLNGNSRTQALNLMTAHLVELNNQIAAGQTTAMIKGATEDKLSVTLEPPPVGTSQLTWWLNLTSYGQQLYALLSMKSVGGIYLGGSAQRQGMGGTAGWC